MPPLEEFVDWYIFECHLKHYNEYGCFPVPVDEDARYAMRVFFLGHNNQAREIQWVGALNIKRYNNKVSMISNEGWYAKNGSKTVKELNLAHKISDYFESNALTSNNVSYDGAFEHMVILPKKELDRRIIGANGCPLPDGSYMFTIGLDEHLRYFPTDNTVVEEGQGSKHFVQYLPHAVLADHGPVYAAGNFGTQGGFLKWVASTSGHYRVKDEMCMRNFAAMFYALGYRFTQDKYLSYSNARNYFDMHKGNKPVLSATRPNLTRTTDVIKSCLAMIHTILQTLGDQPWPALPWPPRRNAVGR